MEREENTSDTPVPSVLGEIFAVTEADGQSPKVRGAAVLALHARLASSEFAEQMTGIFFSAKRAALAQSK